ncbi:hypothetical protein DIC82_03740 [Clostridium beijerinckii]|nr:hypothetical protein DIC82_03740 [Clostridium beijerinckii]
MKYIGRRIENLYWRIWVIIY